MIKKINPGEIIAAHFSTFKKDRDSKICWGSIIFQIILALVLAFIHTKWFEVNENVVGIVVSSASIVAGLLLNLMVLIYTLVTGRLRISKSNVSIMEKLASATIANIAFCILCSVILVVSALCNLTSIKWINILGHFSMCFFGTLVTLTIIIILVNFYTLINNGIK